MPIVLMDVTWRMEDGRDYLTVEAIFAGRFLVFMSITLEPTPPTTKAAGQLCRTVATIIAKCDLIVRTDLDE